MFSSFKTSLIITGFVLLMMLLIEYINVITRGSWQNGMTKHKWVQYLVAIILGATPGCMGAFAVVAMFSHRVVTFGALVATMIATSGDEAFVMFGLFPEKALLLTAILIIIAFVVGWLTDLILSKRFKNELNSCCNLEIHEPEYCKCFSKDKIFIQWLHLSLARGILSLTLILFVLSIIGGLLGPQAWDWKRITLLISGIAGLFITTTVPDHFLKEHLWDHIILKHIPSIFLWTFGALLIVHLITNYLQIEEYIRENTFYVILIAGIVGIIPESGPHLLFVTLFSQGTIPFVVLLTSSIVQDGHGMLPMLAHSRKGFVVVKAINLIVGLGVGFLVYFIGLL